MTPLKYCSVILLRRRECIWIGVGVGIKKNDVRSEQMDFWEYSLHL